MPAPDTISYTPIGVIHSPHATAAGTPLQTVAARGVRGAVELDQRYAEGLRDLEGFSHLILLCHLHEVRRVALTVTPFLDERPHGIFATRSPARPNPIGLSVVRLIVIEGTRLVIEDVDLLDGTPVLDIKPYVPAFDSHAAERIGWLTEQVDRVHVVRADDRFG